VNQMRRYCNVLAALALGTVFLIPAHATAIGFNFTTIDYPGAIKTQAWGINSTGQIAGYYFDTSGAAHGFTYSAGVFTTIDDPSAGGNWTLAYGINNSGQVVGSFFDAPVSVPNAAHAFIDTGGILTTIDDPLSAPGNTTAYGISNSGQAVGHFADATGGHGFLYSGGTFVTINYPGALDQTAAFGIAGSDIVGYFNDAIGTHGFLDASGLFTQIDDPTATPGNTFAFGINDRGQIVGQYNDAAGNHGFLYLDGFYETIDDPSALPGNTFASGINNSGQIVGSYTDASGVHGFLATPTPEPGSWPLLLVGCAAIFAMRAEWRGMLMKQYRRAESALAA
jgi:probable HAF family extracellular repeat protein